MDAFLLGKRDFNLSVHFSVQYCNRGTRSVHFSVQYCNRGTRRGSLCKKEHTGLSKKEHSSLSKEEHTNTSLCMQDWRVRANDPNDSLFDSLV
jgi:hypothetical protein